MSQSSIIAPFCQRPPLPGQSARCFVLRIASCLSSEKKGPGGGPPRTWRYGLLTIVVAVGRQCYQSAIQRNRLQLDGEADAFLVRKRGADLGPALTGLSVALVLFDGEDVQVRVGRGFCGCSGSGDGAQDTAVRQWRGGCSEKLEIHIRYSQRDEWIDVGLMP